MFQAFLNLKHKIFREVLLGVKKKNKQKEKHISVRVEIRTVNSQQS